MVDPHDPDAQLTQLFAPLHKRAMGVAVGTACALAMLLVTGVPLVGGHVEDLGLGLIAQYFYGYTPTWGGALVGAAWAGALGFAAGWLLALCRNALLTLRLVQLRARAEYSKTRDFMDHI